MTRCVLLVATTPWDGAALSDQRLATALSARLPVVYVDPPRAALARGRAPRPPRTTVEQVSPTLVRVTPWATPAAFRPGLRALTSVLHRRGAEHGLRAAGWRPEAVLSAHRDPRLAAGFGERRAVHWAKDDYAAGAALLGTSPEAVRRTERAVAARVDAVVAVSEVLVRKWRDLGHAPHLVPAGVDAAGHARAARARVAGGSGPDDVVLDGPVAGFLGQVSDRLDLGLLHGVVDAGLSLLVVGPRQRTFTGDAAWQALRQRPGVQWVPGRPAAVVPDYLAAMDVGLVPYRDGGFNRASFPLKMLEYLAAGLPVVSTDLPSARWLDSPDVTVTTTAAGFVAATVAASASGPAPVPRRLETAAAHDWALRADAHLAVLTGG